MSRVWLVGLGGFLGSVLRHAIGGLVGRLQAGWTFPLETLPVNVAGCLALGPLAGLAGATVLRGIEGFGAHSRLHTAKILRLSEDLPIVVEIVDALEKIEAFMPVVDQAIGEGPATLERVQVRFYRGGRERPGGRATE